MENAVPRLIIVLFRFLLHFRGFLNISAILQMLSRLLLTARVLNPKSVRTIQKLEPEDLNKIQVLPDPVLVSPRDPTGKSDESIGSGCRVKAWYCLSRDWCRHAIRLANQMNLPARAVG